MGCFVSCRISTDKRVARSLCHGRATCLKIHVSVGPTCERGVKTKLSAQIMKRLKQSIARCGIFRARCNIAYTSRASAIYDVSVRLSVRLSVTEVHRRIIANLGFKFRSQFTAH